VRGEVLRSGKENQIWIDGPRRPQCNGFPEKKALHRFRRNKEKNERAGRGRKKRRGKSFLRTKKHPSVPCVPAGTKPSQKNSIKKAQKRKQGRPSEGKGQYPPKKNRPAHTTSSLPNRRNEEESGHNSLAKKRDNGETACCKNQKKKRPHSERTPIGL